MKNNSSKCWLFFFNHILMRFFDHYISVVSYYHEHSSADFDVIWLRLKRKQQIKIEIDKIQKYSIQFFWKNYSFNINNILSSNALLIHCFIYSTNLSFPLIFDLSQKSDIFEFENTFFFFFNFFPTFHFFTFEIL